MQLCVCRVTPVILVAAPTCQGPAAAAAAAPAAAEAVGFDVDFSPTVSMSAEEQRARGEAPRRRDEGLAEPRYEFHLPGRLSQE